MVLFEFGAKRGGIAHSGGESRYVLLPTFLRNLPLVELPGEIVIALARSLKQFFPENAPFVSQVPFVGEMAQNKWPGRFGIGLVERQRGRLIQFEPQVELTQGELSLREVGGLREAAPKFTANLF